jgi:hypothetical protein
MARGRDLARTQARALFAKGGEDSGARLVNDGGLSSGGGGRTGGHSVLLALGSVLLTASGSAVGVVYSQMQERAAQAEKLAVDRAAALNSVASIIDTRIIRAVQVQKALKLGAPAAELNAAWGAYQDAFIAYNDNSVKTYIAVRRIIQQERPTFFERAINNDITPVLSKWDQCLANAYQMRVEAERDATFRGGRWWDHQGEINAAATACGSPAPIVRACSSHVLAGLYDMSLRGRNETAAAEKLWVTDPSRFSQVRASCPMGYAVYWEESGKDIAHRPSSARTLYSPKFSSGLKPLPPEETPLPAQPQTSGEEAFSVGGAFPWQPVAPPALVRRPDAGGALGKAIRAVKSLGGRAEAAEAH